MGYYVIYDNEGRIVSVKETDAPIPHPDWWFDRHTIYPISESLYRTILHHGPRKFRLLADMKTFREFTIFRYKKGLIK